MTFQHCSGCACNFVEDTFPAGSFVLDANGTVWYKSTLDKSYPWTLWNFHNSGGYSTKNMVAPVRRLVLEETP